MMAEGLVYELPENSGPWMLRAVERWGLLPPYDPSVTEAQWEGYYKERAALEWHTEAYTAGWLGCARDPWGERDYGTATVFGTSNKRAALAEVVEEHKWAEEDFDPPAALPHFGGDVGGEPGAELAWELEGLRKKVERILLGCRGVEGIEELAGKMAEGLYVIKYSVVWEDSDCPRTVELNTRLYSPCGLATSIAFKHDYHFRARAYSIESFTSAKAALRSAADCSPAAPQSPTSQTDQPFVLLSDRSFIGSGTPGTLQQHLLGRCRVLSERKAMLLACAAAGTGGFSSDAAHVAREARRTYSLGASEETDYSESEGDGFEVEGLEDDDEYDRQLHEGPWEDEYGRGDDYCGYDYSGSDSDEGAYW